MPDPDTAITFADAGSLVAAASWDTAKEDISRVGIELELFPMEVSKRDGEVVTTRVLLDRGDPSVLSTLRSAMAAHRLRFRDAGTDPPRLIDAEGGTLTFEPGAQIEHSTLAHHTAAAAIADAVGTAGELDRLFAERSVSLIPLGIDPWHPVASVPQQLRTGRYVAMDRYLAARGPHGAVMMRNTTSLQINVDAPPTPLGTRRWRLANLLAPIWTAWFSTSPAPGYHSARGGTWCSVDPTRTGFPRRLGEAVPIAEIVTETALEADVLLVTRDNGTVPGLPGFRFCDWLTEGHPVWGRPTAADLQQHLTTLFPEVRLRGSVLELRSIDAPPARWLPAVVTFVVGALYDDRAIDDLLDLLTPHIADLPRMQTAALLTGPGHPSLARLATRAMRVALEGAERLGAEHFEPRHLTSAAEFFNRYVEIGTTMAAELRSELGRSTGAALEWATSHKTIERGRFT